ncbi:proline--tRNA ligase [Trichuris suis]|nr:proline--tRNA ligase [Trichuris suis]
MEKRIETRKVRETIARSVCFNIALTFKDGPVGAASQVITPVSSASFTASKVFKLYTADSSKEADSFLLEIYAVGNKIRGLKAQKADKKDIEPLVVELKELKERFQAVTGQSWNPNLVERLLNAGEPKGTSNKNSTGMSDGEECLLKIKALGDKIRQLKAASADKKVIEKEVDELKALKATYKTISGHEWNPGLVDAIAKKTVEVPAAHVDERPPKQDTRAPKEKKEKVSLRLGLEVRKEENFPEWYSQVITKSEMIAYYDISGCYVIRPWAYFIWEQIQSWFDGQIKRLGVSNCYFPIFVSQTALEREKTHVADFSPEVAWVTKSGKSDLAEPVAIRPTSETVMYPSFARWIQSHRDLPLKINQWCNIVRWEFKHPTPFLRTREFLWQEGHTAYASKEDAVKEVYDILNLYARVYEELLAVPVIKGRKTEKEKFAGADFTTTIESYIPSTGRGIQAATSHHLGQNFSKMFEIVYEHPVTQKKEPVYQNSWGLTTRTIGVFTMIHGDNRGLVMPPRVAKFQVVIIPCGITASLAKNTAEKIYETCNELEKTFCSNNVRCMCDLRDNYSPGWKFSHWELKGVPVRLEVGPRDLAEGQVVLVRRDDSSKTVSPIGCVVDEVKRLLDAVQQSLFNRAKDEMDKFTAVVRDWKDFCARVDSRYIVLAPFCTNEDCEDQIKKDSAREESTDPGAPSMGAKSLCIPFEQPEQLSVGQKCIHPMCNRPAECYTLFGRSY